MYLYLMRRNCLEEIDCVYSPCSYMDYLSYLPVLIIINRSKPINDF